MRVYIRDNLLELLPTILEGIEYITKAEIKNAQAVSDECLFAFHSVRETLQKYLSKERFTYYDDLIINLEIMLKNLLNARFQGIQFVEYAQNLIQILDKLKTELQQEPEVKLEILFLPYKSSMWDSLESIWIAAKDDPRCDCYVMPIPYYERDSQGRLAEFHYEGEQFPKNVPITSYLNYNIAERRPDVIYFHNPYDGNNLVTSVAPEYYSDNLKQYTEMLVYVPYFIAGAYRNARQAAAKCLANGVINASRIIVQSEVLRDVYIQNGINPKKVIALGSPKIDAVLKYPKNVEVPLEWRQRIKDKKVVLLNSSIGRLLNNPNYMKELEEIIHTILNFKDVVLIWRPHPLLEATIKSMRFSYLEEFKNLQYIVRNCENGILDESNDATNAVYVSDALMSDNSSLIRTYIMTEKPILILESSKAIKQQVLLSCDIYSCYFYNDGITISKFVEMVKNSYDPLVDNRINDYRKSLANTDGSCGFNIHSYILKEITSITFDIKS